MLQIMSLTSYPLLDPAPVLELGDWVRQGSNLRPPG